MGRALVATGLLTKHMVIVVNVATLEDTMRKNASLIVEKPLKDGEDNDF